MECVRYSKYFLVYHSHLREDATLRLHERFYDREERVRLEVVKAVCEAAADNFDAVPKQVGHTIYCTHSNFLQCILFIMLVLFQLWEDLQGRMRDKVVKFIYFLVIVASHSLSSSPSHITVVEYS